MRDGMTVRVIRTTSDCPNLDVVVSSLGPSVDVLTVEGDVLEHALPRESGDDVVVRFEATPEPLVKSWLFAQEVLSRTLPGDTIIVSDRDGLGGILALGEASKPDEVKRHVVTVAGDGLYLSTMLVAGTVDHLEMPEAATVDWELTQYRYSADVLATCRFAVDQLALLPVVSRIAVEPVPQSPRAEKVESPAGLHGWAPGSVSRRNRSGDVLRAVASVDDASIAVPFGDVEDAVWTGTTWDALSGVVGTMGDRVQRVNSRPVDPSFVVVGDPLAPPGHDVAELRDNGVPILASAGSVAKELWPEIREWGDSDDLAALLKGSFTATETIPQIMDPPPEIGGRAPTMSDRALRVSVGIPVFGSTSYLDECIESVLAQTQSPSEILLVDDGSRSDSVHAELEAWAHRKPGLIRVLKQPNRGVCVARNRLLDEMVGDSFLLLDQDDVIAPDFLHKTSTMLRYDDSLWAVASWTEFFGAYEGVEAKPPFDRRVGLRENPIISTGAVVDMEVRDVGIRFVPDLAFLYCEDWQFWSQIVAAGGRIGLVPEPLILHRVHLASGGFRRTELALRIGRARATEPLLANREASHS